MPLQDSQAAGPQQGGGRTACTGRRDQCRRQGCAFPREPACGAAVVMVKTAAPQPHPVCRQLQYLTCWTYRGGQVGLGFAGGNAESPLLQSLVQIRRGASQAQLTARPAAPAGTPPVGIGARLTCTWMKAGSKALGMDGTNPQSQSAKVTVTVAAHSVLTETEEGQGRRAAKSVLTSPGVPSAGVLPCYS